jgi:DNA-binding NarL/FixJ family response regulator
MRYLLQDELAPAEVLDAGCRETALALLERQAFHLVICSLFSVEGPVDGFLDALLQRAPPGRLIILSSVDEPMLVRRVLVAGAAGFVLKETPPEITLQAIRLVLAGGVYIPPCALSSGPITSAPAERARECGVEVSLTPRQRAVLDLLIQGISNKGIARALDLSAGTVKTHVASLLRLHGVENRTQLVHVASKSQNSAAAAASRSFAPLEPGIAPN